MTKILIVTASDENYGMGLFAMVNSLMRYSDTGFHYDIRVIDNGIKKNTWNLINKSLSKTNKNFTLTKLKMDLSVFNSLKLDYGGGVTTYARILISDFFPEYQRAIYVDADIIVRKDLSALWLKNMEGKPIMACQDTYVGALTPEELDVNKFEIKQECGYFNAGFLVIDMEYWRKFDVSKKLIEYAENNKEFCRFWDQSVLNAFFQCNWLKIESDYNSRAAWHSVEDAISKKINCHFLGPCKPWIYPHKESDHAMHFYSFLDEMGFNWRPSRFKYHVDRQKSFLLKRIKRYIK